MDQIKTIKGFTLLEVMVAMIILSVGVLGMAGLQGTALQSTNAAYMRTVATNQLYDMAERIRSNQQGFTNGEYGGLTSSSTVASCSSARCSSKQVAILDFNDWNTETALRLPSGTGVIKSVAGILVINIRWDQQHVGKTAMSNGSPNCDPKTGPAFQCLSLSFEP